MNLTTFNFNSMNVRTVTDEQGNPWFVSADLCKALKISNVIYSLDDDDKGVVCITNIGSNGVIRERNMTVISEYGLYSLILTSRKPESKVFKKWITSEVLPSIRKMASRSVQQQPSKIPFNEAAAGLDVIYRSLNVSESGKLSLFRGLAEDYGVSTNRLPAYAVDAPTKESNIR